MDGYLSKVQADNHLIEVIKQIVLDVKQLKYIYATGAVKA